MLATRVGALAVTIVGGLLPIVVIGLWEPAAAVVDQRPWLLEGVQAILTLLPTGAAAIVLTEPSSRSTLWPLMALALWGAALGAALAALDRRPIGASRTTHADPAWDTGYDRLGAWFGPELGPLVAKMLRCYVRCPQVRQTLAIVPVVLVQMLLISHLPPVTVATAGVTIVGIATVGLSANVFGFDGAGFRRYWLLPLAPRTILLAAALVALVPGALLLPVVLAAMAVIAPPLAEPRALAMLALCGVAGLLVYQGLGLWASVLAPRPDPVLQRVGHQVVVRRHRHDDGLDRRLLPADLAAPSGGSRGVAGALVAGPPRCRCRRALLGWVDLGQLGAARRAARTSHRTNRRPGLNHRTRDCHHAPAQGVFGDHRRRGPVVVGPVRLSVRVPRSERLWQEHHAGVPDRRARSDRRIRGPALAAHER